MRYAILYFVILVVFLALIVGPIVAAKFIKLPADFASKLPMEILQPTGYNNNDTSTSVTGKCVGGRPCPVFEPAVDATGGGGGGGAAATTDAAARRFRRYMAY